MDEMTQEEALRHAAALVGRALKETETRCGCCGSSSTTASPKGQRHLPGEKHCASFTRYKAKIATVTMSRPPCRRRFDGTVRVSGRKAGYAGASQTATDAACPPGGLPPSPETGVRGVVRG